MRNATKTENGDVKTSSRRRDVTAYDGSYAHNQHEHDDVKFEFHNIFQIKPSTTFT